ncbi:MAG: orotidine-5'-phosphate decarboxylase [Acidisphaera sp.]|nr:orotidine-5'-phosphate decarboxylase [Acidisphaera sp.]
MPDDPGTPSASRVRPVPEAMADRLIVALDVPSIGQARALVERLSPTVSFFKIGLWLAFAEGVDGLIGDLVRRGLKVFLDCKMYDIGQTVQEGVARAADRGVSFVTVHGDAAILESAVRGKGGSAVKIFAVTVLTSLGDRELHEMGYRLTAQELVQLRVGIAVQQGCDGVIASASDNPEAIRREAGAPGLLIATPGVRPAGRAADDHRRSATPGQAIADGADYLVVGRPVIGSPDPLASARSIIREMQGEA